MKDLFDIEQLTQFEFGAIIITVLIAGLVFGCLIAYGLLNRKSNPNAIAAEKIKEEFEEYKEKVDEHFNQTSEMFKDVTTQYKKLYDHMAVGAIELSNADTITMPRLEMQDSEEESEMTADEAKPEADQIEEIAEQKQSAIEETAESENNDDNVEEQIAENTETTAEELAQAHNQEESKTS